jgi:hypothetical protein
MLLVLRVRYMLLSFEYISTGILSSLLTSSSFYDIRLDCDGCRPTGRGLVSVAGGL